MTDAELDALAEAARNATPGPWRRETVCGEIHLRAANGVLVTRPSTAFARGDTPERPDLRECDKAYLEAVNPATVLALLDEVADLRARPHYCGNCAYKDVKQQFARRQAWAMQSRCADCTGYSRWARKRDGEA